MEIKINVQTESNKSGLTKSKKDDTWCAKIKSRAKNNEANNELLDLVSREFEVDRKTIKIIRGVKTTRKVLEITDANK